MSDRFLRARPANALLVSAAIAVSLHAPSPAHAARGRKDMSLGGTSSSGSKSGPATTTTQANKKKEEAKSSSSESKSSSTEQQAAPAAASRFTTDSIQPAPTQNGKRFYLGANGAFAALPNSPADRIGGGGALGFQWNFLLWELRSTFSSCKYGSLMTLPSATDSGTGFTSASDPNSELNRIRSKNDKWNILTINAGMGVHVRLIPDWLPFISEKARFGIQYALASDSANALSLAGWSYSWDTGLQIAFGTSFPMAFEFLWGYNSGSVYNKKIGGQAGRLPLTWTTWSGGLVLWI